MTYNNIALRISGTKERKGGFAPLAMSGIFPKEEEVGLDRAMTGCEGLGFVVKHTPNYSFYMAIDCRVRSFDAQASGVLTIAVTIPARMKLGGGKTPYDLLTELHSLFVEKYMTDNGDGRHVFQNVSVDSEPFKEVLGRYTLEPVNNAVITMSPTGVTGKLNIPHNGMQEFFGDTYYPEFKSFKDIEVGEGLQTSLALKDITIPRPVIYQMYINGKHCGQTDASDILKELTMVDPGDKRYGYFPFIFNLQELKDQGGYLQRDGATVKLDAVNDRIDCELRRFPKTYRVNVRLGDGTNEQKVRIKNWLDKGPLAVGFKDSHSGIDSAYKDVTGEVAADRLELTYDQLQNAKFKVVPEKVGDYEVRVLYKKSDDREDDALLSIKLTEIVKPAPKPSSDLQRQSTPKSKQPKGADNAKAGAVGSKAGMGRAEGGAGNAKAADAAVGDDRLYSGEAYNLGGSGNGNAYTGNPKVVSSADKGDSKMRDILLVLIGLVVGVGIGYCVDRFLLNHEPTKAQVEKIQADYRQKVINEVSDSIFNEINNPQIEDEEGEGAYTGDAGGLGAAAQGNPGAKGNGASEGNKVSGANKGNGAASGAKANGAGNVVETPPAAAKASTPDIAQLKREALKFFNAGDLKTFQKLCSENSQLSGYKEDGTRILQLLFAAGKNPRQVKALSMDDFLNDKGQRGEASKVTNLDQLKSLRGKLENALSGIQ